MLQFGFCFPCAVADGVERCPVELLRQGKATLGYFWWWFLVVPMMVSTARLWLLAVLLRSLSCCFLVGAELQILE